MNTWNDYPSEDEISRLGGEGLMMRDWLDRNQYLGGIDRDPYSPLNYGMNQANASHPIWQVWNYIPNNQKPQWSTAMDRFMLQGEQSPMSQYLDEQSRGTWGMPGQAAQQMMQPQVMGAGVPGQQMAYNENVWDKKKKKWVPRQIPVNPVYRGQSPMSQFTEDPRRWGLDYNKKTGGWEGRKPSQPWAWEWEELIKPPAEPPQTYSPGMTWEDILPKR